MKKIIISLIAFTASLLNLGYSQFAVHSIIDSSGAYSFNYYENKSWSVFPPNLLIDPKNNKNCTKAKRAVLHVGLRYDQFPYAVCAVIATLRPQQRDTEGTKRRQ